MWPLETVENALTLFWTQGQKCGMATGLLPGFEENVGQGEGEQDQGEGVWL